MGISSKSLKAKMGEIKAGGTAEPVVMPAKVFTQGTPIETATVAEPLNDSNANVTTVATTEEVDQAEKQVSEVAAETLNVSPVPGAQPITEDGTVVNQESTVQEEQTATTVAEPTDQTVPTVEEHKEAERTAETVTEEVSNSNQAGTSTVAENSGFEETSLEEFNAESPISSQQTLSDSSAFQQLTQSSSETGIGSNSSYAELVESMVSQQCQLSGVKNLDLTTFGLRAQVLDFPNLSVMTYGKHKFLGAPFTEEEEDLIVHRLALHVAQSEKKRIVIRAVQEVKDERGMSFFSLLFDDKIAQKFVNMFNYTVHANMNEADISKLVLVIQK